MDGQSGDSPGNSNKNLFARDATNKVFGEFAERGTGGMGRADSGGASRFFPQFRWSPDDDPAPWLYTAKAASAERPRAARTRLSESGEVMPSEGGLVAHPT